MLEWLHAQRFADAILPQVMALEYDEPFALLFLSPPERPVRQRPGRPDAADARFLIGLAALGVDRAPLDAVFDQ